MATEAAAADTVEGGRAGTAGFVAPALGAPAQASRRLTVKRCLDCAVAAVLLVLLAPLLAVLALVVRLDSPGPVLFRQRRYGQGLEPFTILKFRTMFADSSPDFHRNHFASLANGSLAGEPNGLKKPIDDPRLTRSGRVMRRWSLDELPQLINVLRGHMSLVGPRPAIGYELDHYRSDDFVRFMVRPGMTGLWQVSGRNHLGVREMLALDARYAREWSLRLDARILLRTPRAATRGSA